MCERDSETLLTFWEFKNESGVAGEKYAAYCQELDAGFDAKVRFALILCAFYASGFPLLKLVISLREVCRNDIWLIAVKIANFAFLVGLCFGIAILAFTTLLSLARTKDLSSRLFSLDKSRLKNIFRKNNIEKRYLTALEWQAVLKAHLEDVHYSIADLTAAIRISIIWILIFCGSGSLIYILAQEYLEQIGVFPMFEGCTLP